MEIAQVEKAAYEVVIKSDKGIAVKNGTEVTLTATLYLGGQPYSGEVSYRWYNLNNKDGTLSNNSTYKIDLVSFNDSGYAQYGCEITVS